MQVTTALLADAATVENGKLYVHGGGLTVFHAKQLPVTHPSMALALVFRVEYTEALRDHEITIELLDEDDHRIGSPISLLLNVGHPPRTPPGTPMFVPQAIRMNLVRFEREGGYRFRVRAGSGELASVPFRVALRPRAKAP